MLPLSEDTIQRALSSSQTIPVIAVLPTKLVSRPYLRTRRAGTPRVFKISIGWGASVAAGN